MNDAVVKNLLRAIGKESMKQPTKAELNRMRQVAFLRNTLEAKLDDITNKKSTGEWLSRFYSSSVKKVALIGRIENLLKALEGAEKAILGGKKVVDMFSDLQKKDLEELGMNTLLYDSSNESVADLQSRIAVDMMRKFRGYEQARSFVEDYYFKDDFDRYRKILDTSSIGKAIEERAHRLVDKEFSSQESQIKSEFRKKLRESGKDLSDEEFNIRYNLYLESSKEELALRMKNFAVAQGNINNFRSNNRVDAQILDSYKRVIGINEHDFSDSTTDMIVDELVANAPLILASGAVGGIVRSVVSRIVASNAIKYGDKLSKVGLYVGYGKNGERALKSIGAWGDIVMAGAKASGFALETSIFTATSSVLSGDVYKMTGQDFINAALHNAAVLGAFKFGSGTATKVCEALKSRFPITAINHPLIAKIGSLAAHGSAELATMLAVTAMENSWAHKELNLFISDRELLHVLITVGALHISKGVATFAGKRIVLPAAREAVETIGKMRNSIKSKVELDGVAQRSEQSEGVAKEKLNKGGSFFKEAMSDLEKLEDISKNKDTINLSLKEFKSLSEAVTKSNIPNKGEILMDILAKMPSIARLGTKKNIEKLTRILTERIANDPRMKSLGIKASEISDALLRNKKVAGILSAIMLYPSEVFAFEFLGVSSDDVMIKAAEYWDNPSMAWVDGTNLALKLIVPILTGSYVLKRTGSELSMRGVNPIDAAGFALGKVKAAILKLGIGLINRSLAKNDPNGAEDTSVSDNLNIWANKWNRLPGKPVAVLDNLVARARNTEKIRGNEDPKESISRRGKIREMYLRATEKIRGNEDPKESISRRGKIREMYLRAKDIVVSVAREIDKLIAEEPELADLRLGKNRYERALLNNLDNFAKLGEVDEMRDHTTNLEIHLTALRNSIQEFRKSKARAVGVDESVFENFENSRRNLTQAIENLKEHKRAKETARKAKDTATAEKNSAKTRLDKVSKKLDEANAKKDQIKNELLNPNYVEYQNLRSSLSDSERRLAQLESLGSDTTEENLEMKEDLKIEVGDLKKKIEKLEAAHPNLENLMSSKNSDLAKTLSNIAKLQTEYDAINRLFLEADGKLSQFSRDYSTAETEYTTAEAALNTARTDLENATKARNDATEAIKKSRGVDASAGKRAELDAAIAKRDALKASFETLEGEYNSAKAKYDASKDMESNLPTDPKNYDAKAQIELLKLRQSISTDKGNFAAIEKKYEKVKQELETADKDVNRLTSEYTPLSAPSTELANIKSSLSKLKSFIEGTGNVNIAASVEILKSQKWRRLAGDVIVVAALWYGSGLIVQQISNYRKANASEENAEENAQEAETEENVKKKVLEKIDDTTPSTTTTKTKKEVDDLFEELGE
ncbi:hypothetical protein COU74_03130 [Candidatus Peregrinibacteria bacterium CG10_big_fil_rev_8_21_14_0_10_36_19]|nr:MAG: hypothetical protein COU74_03130 [Candidatus Peregrinibacteria bacterium CG10_big_fil_rev_8_21_14_0_10_36_19]